MMRYLLAILVFAVGLVGVAAPRALGAGKLDFELKSGESVRGELIGVYNGMVYVDRGRGATSWFPFQDLVGEGRAAAEAWFQEWVVEQAGEPDLVADSDSRLTQFLAGQLVTWNGSELVDYAFAGRPEPEFYAFYYSAHWCGPCRRFTPKLRAFYNTMRSMGQERFEIVFVSSDESRRMMEQYMSEDKMPWPAVSYGKRQHSLVAKYKGSGIPCLVVTDKYGHVLSHSYSGDEYLGPSVPMDHLGLFLRYLSQVERAVAERAGATAEG